MGQFIHWLQLLFDSDQNVLISGTYDDQLALWATGKAAFITQGDWIDPSLPTYEADFPCGIAPAAFTTEDTEGIVDAQAVWGIYNGSDKIDACKKFLKALAESEEGQKALVEDCRNSTRINPAPWSQAHHLQKVCFLISRTARHMPGTG